MGRQTVGGHRRQGRKATGGRLQQARRDGVRTGCVVARLEVSAECPQRLGCKGEHLGAPNALPGGMAQRSDGLVKA